jgi:hypothetical protein
MMNARLNTFINRHPSATMFVLFGMITAAGLYGFQHEAEQRREDLCQNLNEMGKVVTEVVTLSFSTSGGSSSEGGLSLTFPPYYDQIEDQAVKDHFAAIEKRLSGTNTPSERERVLTEYVEENLQPKDCNNA